MHAHLVDGKNVGMVQGRGGSGFLLEPAQAVGSRETGMTGRTLMATSRPNWLSRAR